jgi:AraC-like DNA-binding protein
MYSTLLASATSTLWKTLEQGGFDCRNIFERADLDPAAVRRPGARYSYPKVRRLWDLALEATGDPCLGLRVGQQWHPSAAHALGYAWLASDTLREAFERLVRYIRVISTDKETVVLQALPAGYLFFWDLSQVYYRASDVEFDEAFAALVKLCRMSAGDEFAPIALKMQRPVPDCAAEFENYFRAPIEYAADENSLLFPRDIVESPLPSSNILMARECDRIVDTYLASLDKDDVVSAVRGKLIERLPDGSTTENMIASELNMSVRSLQRRLSGKGLTFKQLLDDTRRELALRYVRDPSITINEMTYMLGYSEPANFSRAFKRWTGMSPSESRAA